MVHWNLECSFLFHLNKLTLPYFLKLTHQLFPISNLQPTSFIIKTRFNKIKVDFSFFFKFLLETQNQTARQNKFSIKDKFFQSSNLFRHVCL